MAKDNKFAKLWRWRIVRQYDIIFQYMYRRRTGLARLQQQPDSCLIRSHVDVADLEAETLVLIYRLDENLVLRK